MRKERPSPFRYPQLTHKRRLAPGPFGDYRRYKSPLREEFHEQCVYCRLPDGAGSVDEFGVEHYKPKSRFPELATDYSNLFYCCNTCNRRKGDRWPDDALRKLGRFIPNPCDHVMFAHVRYTDAEVTSRTPAGEYLVELLDLNDPAWMARREMVVTMLRAAVKVRAETEQSLTQLRKKLAKATEETKKKLEAGIVSLEQEVATLDRTIRRLCPQYL